MEEDGIQKNNRRSFDFNMVKNGKRDGKVEGECDADDDEDGTTCNKWGLLLVVWLIITGEAGELGIFNGWREGDPILLYTW